MQSFRSPLGPRQQQQQRRQLLRSPAPLRLTVVAMARGRRAMSEEVVQSVAQARREAARQGCMFVGAGHLVLGLLATPSRASAILQRYLHADDARVQLDKHVVLPLDGSQLLVGDVELSPTARELLSFGMECAREQGCDVLGCGHLAVVLIQDDRSPLRSLLLARQAPPVRAIEDEILADAEQHPEGAATLASPEEQAAQLRRLAAVHASNGQQPRQDEVFRRQAAQQQQDEYE